jgi:uncharacterized protein (TIGR02172 family)
MTTNKLGQLIGRGREAEMYAWGEDQVLKLSYPSRTRGSVEEEARAARVADEAGVPTPAVGEIIEVDSRYGVIFERVDGPSMLEQMVTHPWQLPRLARQLAELQASIHAYKAPGIRSLKDELRGRVEDADADTRLKEAVLRRIEPLPDGDSLCHGDFHPDNIIMSSRGPMIIDWTCGRRASPLADVARTWLLLRMSEPLLGNVPPWILPVLKALVAASRVAVYGTYLKRYRRFRPFADKELAAWKLPTVALRLAREDIPEERRRMMDYLERALSRQGSH